MNLQLRAILGGYRGRATKCRQRCCKEVITCVSKVFPEVRFAINEGGGKGGCLTATVVGGQEENKNTEKTIPVFAVISRTLLR